MGSTQYLSQKQGMMLTQGLESEQLFLHEYCVEDIREATCWAEAQPAARSPLSLLQPERSPAPLHGSCEELTACKRKMLGLRATSHPWLHWSSHAGAAIRITNHWKLDVHQASTVSEQSCLAQHVPVMDGCTGKFSHLVGEILSISFLTRNKSIYGWLLFINNPAPHYTAHHMYLASSVIYYPFFSFLFLNWNCSLRSSKFVVIAIRSFPSAGTSRSLLDFIFPRLCR